MAKQKRRSKGNGLTVFEAVSKYAHLTNAQLAELTGATLASIYRARWEIKQGELPPAHRAKSSQCAQPTPPTRPAPAVQMDMFKEWQEDEAPKAAPVQPNNVRVGLDESVIAELRIAAERLSSALQKLA